MITLMTKNEIISLLQQGYNESEIARKTKFSRTTAQFSTLMYKYTYTLYHYPIIFIFKSLIIDESIGIVDKDIIFGSPFQNPLKADD